MGVKLTHGLQDGKVVKVTNVANGLACRCMCIDCKSPLIAVNNPGISCKPHFRHSDGKAKEIKACKASFETAIHYQAKDIIEKRKELSLPEYWVVVDKHNGKGTREHRVKEKQHVKFDDVKNENRVSTSQGAQDIKPDLIGIYKERKLFIEIAVCHKAENEKIESLKRHNISAVEIDLSKFPRSNNEDDLEKYLYTRAPIKWLYHVRHESFHQEAVKKEQAKAKAFERHEKQREKERLALEIKNKEKHLDRLRDEFIFDIENNIVKNEYNGLLLERISQFVKSRCSGAISCYRSNGFIRIEHEIEGLGDIFCYETDPDDDLVVVECEFIGLNFNNPMSLKGYSINNAGFFIVANIYYQACLILCADIENKISSIEEERQIAQKNYDEYLVRLRLEKEARDQEQSLKMEQARQADIEQTKRNEQTRQEKLKEKELQLARQNIQDEELFMVGTKEILERNKKNPRKDPSISPSDLLSVLKKTIANVDEKFIAIRSRLQNKGRIKKVDVNKLKTAKIVIIY